MLAGIGLGVAGEWVGFGWSDPRHWIPDLIVGWSLIGCGLVASVRRPESRSGTLMAATGFTWFFGNFASTGIGVIDWAASHALFLHRGPLVHLLLAYPSGRLSSRLERATVASGYAVAFVTPVWRSDVATIALASLLVVVGVRAYLRAVGPARRAQMLSLRAVLGLGLVLAGAAAARLAFPSSSTDELTLLMYEALLCALAGGLLAGFLSASWQAAAVTDLVVELGERQSRTLREQLARALGDPTLALGYWLPEAQAFVDADGVPFSLPDRPDRAVTIVEREDRPIAALVHDPVVLDDPGLVEAVSLAAGMAASNARLQAEVRVQVAELGASRRRILEAGDLERRRLESRLHDGAERKLRELGQNVRRARASARAEATCERIDQAETQLALALEELQQLAHGLHPRVLSERGLAGALASLAARSPEPVAIAVDVDRLPAPVEAAAYFVCSEALANVAKYASASRVAVSVTARNGRVTVQVEDDGAGGADPARGTGLRGLTDRIDALGGTLRIESPPGRGTRITAVIPL
jgi:signal transduction histidine kinase